MASEILGLFTSPQQYQQQQQDLARSRAMEFARLDPFQQANAAIGQGAYGLAGAIGGALGGTDPQLEMISKRNVLLGQLDQSDPESFMKVAQAAAQMGDAQFAMAIAQEGRKAKTEMARATQLGAEKMTKEQRNAMAYASQFGTPDSIEYKEAYQQRFDDLTLRAGKENKPFEFEAKEARLQELKSALRVQQNQPTQNKEAIQRLEDSIQAIEGSEKQDIPKIGVSEATGEAVYFDRNQDLQFVKRKDPKDPTKQIRVPFEGRIDQTTSKVSATATLPGVKEFKDIPELRSKILGVVEPFRKAVNATDNALESLDLSITENNFIGFNAARVQLAKALAGGDLSQKEIAAAGGDPSIFGGLIDMTSTAFTGTPSLDTQNKIKKTINAIRKVALKKGRDEIDAQRNVATKSGFNTDDFSAASDIPEFRPRGKKVPTEVKTFDADKERRYQDWKAKQTGATR